MTIKEINIYRLTDAQGNQTATVVDELSDSGRIGGYDKNGVYQQYDSYELYHAYDWAAKHGMKLEFAKIEVNLDTIKFN